MLYPRRFGLRFQLRPTGRAHALKIRNYFYLDRHQLRNSGLFAVFLIPLLDKCRHKISICASLLMNEATKLGPRRHLIGQILRLSHREAESD